jgi:hypothetical protein
VRPRDTDLSGLVSELATEDAERARAIGGQVLYAMAGALEALPGHAGGKHPRELRDRAERLAGAAELDYSRQLVEALTIAVDALDEHTKKSADVALIGLRTQARSAIARIAADRPFSLQRAAVQDAVRLIADTLTVAAAAR